MNLSTPLTSDLQPPAQREKRSLSFKSARLVLGHSSPVKLIHEPADVPKGCPATPRMTAEDAQCCVKGVSGF